MYSRLVLVLVAISTISAETLTITGIARDFTPATNPDFESYLGSERGIPTNTLPADRAPVLSAGSHATVTSAASFYQWYHDSDASIKIPISIELTKNSNGVYTYDNSAFFPIDNQGYGNYGSNNFHFTTAFNLRFTYNGGEVFSFSGDDDVWVYINNALVIDLGGVHGPESNSVALDSLGLTVGNSYNLDIFQAERHTSGSNFKIETTLYVVPVPTQVCGNGKVEGTEQCDGGNCCTSTCTIKRTAKCFCAQKALADGEMEYYCNGDAGFYQCLGGQFAPQSRAMTCAQGTHCGCADGAECSCNRQQSPCVTVGETQHC